MFTCETKAIIFKGADATFDIQLMDQNNNFYNLTGTTELKAYLKKSDGTIMEKDLTSGVVIAVPFSNGKLSISFTEVETALLPEGRNQDIELEIINGTDTKIVQLLKVLEVRARLFV